MTEFKHLVRRDIEPRVGGQSLIGVNPLASRPVGWGNYFNLLSGERVLNMWAENLTAAVRTFDLGNKVSALYYAGDNQYRSCVLIDDPRIPDDWYYKKLCFTGSSARPSNEALKEWWDYKGDPTNEFEQFTDPKEYWAKRGYLYSENVVQTGPDIKRDLELQGYGPFK